MSRLVLAALSGLLAGSLCFGLLPAGAGVVGGAVLSHGDLQDLTAPADDHTQYALLSGRAGSQTLIGGTAASEDLVLQSTDDATRGSVVLGSAGNSAYDEVNDRLGIGTGSPTQKIEALGNILANSSGSAFFLADRGAVTNFSGLQLLTAGTVKWTIGSRNDSTDDLHFFSNGAGATEIHLDDTNGNLGLRTTTEFGTGAGVIGIANADTDPTTNPTGGGVLYATGGAGTWRGSSGTVTTFGPAGPHCGRCGYDFWRVVAINERWGASLRECGWCGKVYRQGPASVLERLTAEERAEVLQDD